MLQVRRWETEAFGLCCTLNSYLQAVIWLQHPPESPPHCLHMGSCSTWLAKVLILFPGGLGLLQTFAHATWTALPLLWLILQEGISLTFLSKISPGQCSEAWDTCPALNLPCHLATTNCVQICLYRYTMWELTDSLLVESLRLVTMPGL